MRDPAPARLFHYTCIDGARSIEATRTILPNRHPLLDVPVVWLTDMEVPDRLALGLIPSVRVPCDRAAYRVEVSPDDVGRCTWWPKYARTLPRATRSVFEYGTRGENPAQAGRPVHWWVATEPLVPLGVEHLTPRGGRR